MNWIQKQSTALLVLGCILNQCISAEFIGLGFLDSHNESHATAVSNDGAVVAGWSLPRGVPEPETGFRWTRDGGLDSLGVWSSARAISGDGTILAGIRFKSFSQPGNPGFWDQDNHFHEITSSTGSVSGASFDGAHLIGTSSREFLWTSDGQQKTLGRLPGMSNTVPTDISGTGTVVVGVGTDPGRTWEAWRWDAKSGMVGLGHLPGFEHRSNASAVSTDGSVIVGWSRAEPEEDFTPSQAFLWTADAGMMGLAPKSIDWSAATDVSADGSIVVGSSEFRIDHREGFIWTDKKGMRKLQGVLADDYGLGDQIRGWERIQPSAISADGNTIVGTGTNPRGAREAFVTYLSDLAPVVGDFNSDGLLDVQDIDLLSAAILSTSPNALFDIDESQRVDRRDLDYMLQSLLNSLPGDTNLDGHVDFSDFVSLSSNFGSSGGWAQGDFDANRKVDFVDFLIFSSNFTNAPNAATVPEPNTCGLILMVLILKIALRRRNRSRRSQSRAVARVPDAAVRSLSSAARNRSYCQRPSAHASSSVLESGYAAICTPSSFAPRFCSRSTTPQHRAIQRVAPVKARPTLPGRRREKNNRKATPFPFRGDWL